MPQTITYDMNVLMFWSIKGIVKIFSFVRIFWEFKPEPIENNIKIKNVATAFCQN